MVHRRSFLKSLIATAAIPFAPLAKLLSKRQSVDTAGDFVRGRFPLFGKAECSFSLSEAHSKDLIKLFQGGSELYFSQTNPDGSQEPWQQVGTIDKCELKLPSDGDAELVISGRALPLKEQLANYHPYDPREQSN